MSDLRFFNPYAEIRHTENRLPHWQQEGAVYFVTFRLADAIPSRLRGQWENEREAWLRLQPEPWSNEIEQEYHRRFSGALERCLDAGHGACLLRRPDCAQIVAETLHHFEGERVAMISFVVMPNHVHALFVQNPVWPLEKLIRSWKGFTARQINKLLGRSGNFWQRDYFDRLIRDEKHFLNLFAISGGIRRKPGCRRNNLFFGKAMSRRRSVNKEGRFPNRPLFGRRFVNRRSLACCHGVRSNHCVQRFEIGILFRQVPE